MVDETDVERRSVRRERGAMLENMLGEELKIEKVELKGEKRRLK